MSRSRVDEHRRDDCLEGICENGVAITAAAAAFSGAEYQRVADAESSGCRRKTLTSDNPGPQECELALRRVRARLEQMLGDDEFEERISEKLETLVVVWPRTAMRQRADEQLRIGDECPSSDSSRCWAGVMTDAPAPIRIVVQSMDLPIRFQSIPCPTSQFIQIPNALPMRRSSETVPQYRLSLLLSRLSPRTK